MGAAVSGLTVTLHEPGVLALEGELDMSSAELLLSHAEAGDPGRDLVLELSGLRFMDSSGLRAILQIAHRREGDAIVVLRNPTPPVERVLRISLPGPLPGLRIESSDGRRGG
jgi:anti-anti-sigma factor